MKKGILPFLVISFLSPTAMAATSVAEYLQRIQEAIRVMESVKEDGEDLDSKIVRLKELLPKTEEVETTDNLIQVNNSWFHTNLDLFKAEPSQEKRLELRDHILKRLQSLIESVKAGEAEAEKVAEQSDPHADVRQILLRTEYKEKKEDWLTTQIKKIRKAVLDLLRELYLRAFQAIFGTGAQASWLFRLLIILTLGALVFSTVRMAMRYRRGKKPEKTRTVLGEEIEEDVSAQDLAAAALTAARLGDFRTAIRKLYISFLYELADRHLIELEANATNHDYLSKVSRFESLRLPMRFMTERFDYVWYGMFPTSESDFSVYQKSYEEALRSAQSLELSATQTPSLVR